MIFHARRSSLPAPGGAARRRATDTLMTPPPGNLGALAPRTRRPSPQQGHASADFEAHRYLSWQNYADTFYVAGDPYTNAKLTDFHFEPIWDDIKF